MILALLFVVRAQFLMGTVCEIDAANPEPAFAEARRIEGMISTWRDDSELSRLNRGEIANPSPELSAMLSEAMAISRETGGAFDPTIGRITLPRRGAKGMIDEGGFGKGYALDRMLALLEGEAMINFGGQIVVRGAREVSIAHPLHRGRPAVTLTLRNASLSTSSDSEQPGHIIDPTTGQSVPSWGSVSVIDPSAFRADALSTALYVMGPERGLAWAIERNIVAIFISDSGEIKWSKKPY
jgi:thiamine biosynthesis lipoprotein